MRIGSRRSDEPAPDHAPRPRVLPAPTRVDPRRTFVSLSRVRKPATDGVVRLTVSLPKALAKQLDQMTREKGFDNRSVAVADLIRAGLVEHHQNLGDREIAGTITLVYDHHRQHVQGALTDIQHDHHEMIISTLHVHLDHDTCMEVLAVRGKARAVKKIADELMTAKGVKHGKLTVTTSAAG